MDKNKLSLWGALVLTVAAANAAFLILGDNRPRYDEKEYDHVGGRFAAGRGLTTSDGVLYYHSHPPLYAAFVGAVYAVHQSRIAVACAQTGLAAVILLCVAAIARRVYGPRTATLAAFVVATYLPLAFYVTRLLSEVLFTALLACGLYLFLRALACTRRRWPWLVAAGLTFGAAALTRGVALVNAAGLTAYLAGRRGEGGRVKAAGVAAFVAGVAAAVLPWSWYVHARTGDWILVDAKGSEVFWLGNNAATPTHHAWDVIGDRSAAAAAAVIPAGVTASDTGRYYRAAAWEYIRRHPGPTAIRFLTKAADMWEMERLAAGARIAGHFDRGFEPFLTMFVAAEIVVSAVALVLFWWGLALAPRTPWRAVFVNVVVSTTGAYALTLSHPRYNFPLVLCGAVALAGGVTITFSRERRAALSPGRWVLAVVAAVAQTAVLARAVWLYITYGS